MACQHSSARCGSEVRAAGRWEDGLVWMVATVKQTHHVAFRSTCESFISVNFELLRCSTTSIYDTRRRINQFEVRNWFSVPNGISHPRISGEPLHSSRPYMAYTNTHISTLLNPRPHSHYSSGRLAEDICSKKHGALNLTVLRRVGCFREG